MNQPEQIAFILKKHLEGDCIPQVQDALLQVIEAHPEFNWEALLAPYFEDGQPDADFTEDRWAAILQGILQYQAVEPAKERKPASLFSMKHWRWASIAALLLLMAGGYLWQPWKQRSGPDTAVVSEVPDIPSGTDGAVLTLADGTQVLLDTLKNGVVAVQQGTQVLLQNGRLNYAGQQSAAGAIVYNTITTPKGRQFQLQLPDGSVVWLNAGSSMRYPIRFAADKRSVAVTGEVYFDIAPDAARPFWVDINGRAEIQVLGTGFNINAYDNETAVKTTLLEGTIKVKRNSETVLLYPGQQAQVTESIKVTEHVDVNSVIAWKKGLFQFENTDLPTVMRQIERWYDIEVKYNGTVPAIQFNGKMDRGVSLKGFTGFLADYGLKATLNGRVLMLEQGK